DFELSTGGPDYGTGLEPEFAEAELGSELAEVPETITDEHEVAESGPILTGDLETDLMALGLGELPTEDLLFPIGDYEPTEEAEASIQLGELQAEPPVLDRAQSAVDADEVERAREPVDDLSDLLEAAEWEPELEVEPYLEIVPEIEAEDEGHQDLAETPPDLADLLESLESDEGLEVVETDFDDKESTSVQTGVISTDAYLADISSEELGVGLSSGMGDELSALTGAGGRSRPSVSINKIPEPGRLEIHRDQAVDKELVLKIIEGIEKL
ncbi:MAG: hypothetical protein U1E22_08975, partial [Coriobacteriia bacterium]|nr:hypothetical protein [Coriobacteriia bacterium]